MLRTVPSGSITRIERTVRPTDPERWSMPCAFTEREPPTLKMSVDCIDFTAHLGWMAF